MSDQEIDSEADEFDYQQRLAWFKRNSRYGLYRASNIGKSIPFPLSHYGGAMAAAVTAAGKQAMKMGAVCLPPIPKFDIEIDMYGKERAIAYNFVHNKEENFVTCINNTESNYFLETGLIKESIDNFTLSGARSNMFMEQLKFGRSFIEHNPKVKALWELVDAIDLGVIDIKKLPSRNGEVIFKGYYFSRFTLLDLSINCPTKNNVYRFKERNREMYSILLNKYTYEHKDGLELHFTITKRKGKEWLKFVKSFVTVDGMPAGREAKIIQGNIYDRRNYKLQNRR